MTTKPEGCLNCDSVATRHKLADERASITHRFAIQSAEGEKDFYVTCGLYPDGRIGEVFIIAGKEGSLISAALDGLSTMISIGLQYGAPLEAYIHKLRYTQFEPSGRITGIPSAMCPDGRPFFAKSPFDYLAAWLTYRFPDGFIRKE